MSKTALEELRLDNLRDGRFLAAAEADFRRVVQGMIAYADRHASEAGGIAIKGKLTIDVDVERTGNGGWIVQASTKIKLPGRPAMVAFPLPHVNDLGEMTLFQPPMTESPSARPELDAPEIAEG